MLMSTYFLSSWVRTDLFENSLYDHLHKKLDIHGKYNLGKMFAPYSCSWVCANLRIRKLKFGWSALNDICMLSFLHNIHANTMLVSANSVWGGDSGKGEGNILKNETCIIVGLFMLVLTS